MMKRAFLLLCLIALLLPQAGRSQGGRETPNRFLFVIERSSAMKRAEAATLNTLQQLIATGAYGAMRRGDIYTIWTFDREIHDQQFAPHVWLPEVSSALAATAAKFLKDQKYSWSTKLDPVVARFVQVMKTTPAMTVFLITDGSEVLFGTPFDLEVSTIVIRHAAEMAREKRPFVITLVAQEGTISAWAVDAGGGRITVPVVPKASVTDREPQPESGRDSPKPVVKVPVTAVPVNPPKPPPAPEPVKPAVAETPKVAIPTKPEPPPVTLRPVMPDPVVSSPEAKPAEPMLKPAPKPASAPKSVTVEPPVALPSPAVLPPMPKSAPPPKLESPPAAPATVPEPVPSAPQAVTPQPAPEKPTPVAAPLAPATPIRSNDPPLASTPEPVTSAPQAPVAPPPLPPPAQTAVVVPGDSAATGWRFVIMGGALLALAAIMIVALWRRSRVPAPSLITQSLDRERK